MIRFPSWKKETTLVLIAYFLFKNAQYRSLYYTYIQSKPCKMFAATLQPSWQIKATDQRHSLLFYCIMKLYNFVFYEVFVGSTSSWGTATMDLKNHDGTKISQKTYIFRLNFEVFHKVIDLYEISHGHCNYLEFKIVNS